ncbi:hypothetical protein ATY75_15305 [Rhizobium sp. N122]|nr:hypothetical protein ATY75_15305 [Rhizobium sp. N122]
MIPYLPRYLPTLNQSEDNRQIILDFARANTSPLTLAGTSLLYRLSPNLFSQKTANISLPGQSPVSSAMSALQIRPKVLVIEINILDRPRDLQLEHFAKSVVSPPLGFPALGPAYSPVRSIVSIVYNLDAKADKRELASANAARKLLSQLPEPLKYTETISSMAKALDSRPVSATINQSAQELRIIADRIEAQGGKTYYLLMPMHPLLAATDYEARSRHAMIDADPKFGERLLNIKWDDEIRWESDGAHLDKRSAVIAARQLEQAIANKAE